MSETVKLIIELQKKEYEGFKELIAINIGGRCSGKGIIRSCLNAVKNGIPLDDVKAEIEKKYREAEFMNEFSGGYNHAINEVLEVLKSIGKGDSE